MEEDRRPLTERDRKILNEARKVQKLRREQGCRLVDCGVVINNTNLRIEIIDLKRKIREQEKMIELMGVDLMCCGADFVSFGMFTGNFKKDKELVIEHYKKKAKGE